MQLIGNMYEHLLKSNNKTINIVVATSGDTGAAAIDAIKGKSNLNEEEFKNAILGTGFEVVKVVKSDKFIDDAGEARKLVD